MEKLTFEKLPEAISLLFGKLDQIEKVLLLIRQQEQPLKQEELMTVEETALFLNLKVPTIYSKTCKAELPFLKRGSRLYFSRQGIMDYLKQGKHKTYAEIQSNPEAFLKTKRNRRA